MKTNGDAKVSDDKKVNGATKDEQAEEGAKNAFDQVKADEREEGKTTVKVRNNLRTPSGIVSSVIANALITGRLQPQSQ